MKTETIVKRLTLLAGMAATIAVAGCTTPYGPYAVYDSVTPARDMCAVESLAERRAAMLDEAYGYRVVLSGPPEGEYYPEYSRTRELLAAFEGDLDASYNLATSSCRTYNRCLEENRFEEYACQGSAALWHDSQNRFHDLSENLAVIRENIASFCNDCRRGGYRGAGYGRPGYGHDYGPGYGYRPPHRGPSYRYWGDGYGYYRPYHRRSYHAHRRNWREDDLLGSVFSTAEGYDSSYHDGHH